MTAVTEYAVFARFPRTVHARNVGDRTGRDGKVARFETGQA